MSEKRIAAVLVVRNEVDIIRLCVLHHLAIGCERIFVLDNGSSDGTEVVLQRLAARVPLSWSSDAGTYQQAEFATGLAHQAARDGADWILPLDADEFWVAPNGLHAALDSSSDSGAMEVARVEFIQSRGQRHAQPAGVFTMTRRVAAPLEGLATIHAFQVGECSMFEAKQAPKLAVRASPELEISRGAHSASGLLGSVEATDAVTTLACAAARPRMSRAQGGPWRSAGGRWRRRNRGVAGPPLGGTCSRRDARLGVGGALLRRGRYVAGRGQTCAARPRRPACRDPYTVGASRAKAAHGAGDATHVFDSDHR